MRITTCLPHGSSEPRCQTCGAHEINKKPRGCYCTNWRRHDRGTKLMYESSAEEWRDIPGYAGYQASSEGRIRSLDRLVNYAASKNGCAAYSMVRKGGVLKTPPMRSGHLQVNLGRKAHFLVHVLVVLAFHGSKPLPGLEVLHRDGNPANNKPGNVRWGTRSENNEDVVFN